MGYKRKKVYNVISSNKRRPIYNMIQVKREVHIMRYKSKVIN